MGLRIERLDLRPWGCFDDLTVDLGGPVGTVHLLYGPNAAGKSTATRALRGLLFGIEPRTRDAHTHAYTDLRIGARLWVDGPPLEVVRKKGTRRTLLDASGDPLADDPLAIALGGLSSEVHKALFQITHESLVEGGEELLQGKGEVGASLFAAAAGIATLHDTLA